MIYRIQAWSLGLAVMRPETRYCNCLHAVISICNVSLLYTMPSSELVAFKIALEVLKILYFHSFWLLTVIPIIRRKSILTCTAFTLLLFPLVPTLPTLSLLWHFDLASFALPLSLSAYGASVFVPIVLNQNTIWIMMNLGLEEGEYKWKLSLCYSIVHYYNGAQRYEQFYRSVDCIGLWSCLV